MPSSKSKRTTVPAAAAGTKSERKPPYKPEPPKPHGKPPIDTIIAEPPIIVTSGSVDIEMDKSIFPQDPSNPNKHKNASRRLTSMEIQDLSSPPTTLMVIDLKSLARGKCKILIKYEK